MSDSRFKLIIGGAIGALIIIGYVVLLAMKIENAALITTGGGFVLAALGFGAVKVKGNGKKAGVIALAVLPALLLGGCHQSPSQQFRTMREAHILTTKTIIAISQLDPDSIPLKDLKRYGLLDIELKAGLDVISDTLRAGGNVSQASLDHIKRRLGELKRIQLDAQRKKEGTPINVIQPNKHLEDDHDRNSSGRVRGPSMEGDRQRARRTARLDRRRIHSAAERSGYDIGGSCRGDRQAYSIGAGRSVGRSRALRAGIESG